MTTRRSRGLRSRSRRSGGFARGIAAVAESLERRALLAAASIHFDPIGQFDVGPESARVVAAGDFNGDGNADLIIGLVNGVNDLTNPDQRAPGGRVALMLSDAVGMIIAQPSFAVRADALEVADFNNDGYDDIAAADYYSGQVRLIRGGPGPTYAAPVVISNVSGPLAAGDINGDGRVDLVIADLVSKHIPVLMGNGNGTFGGSTKYALTYMPTAVRLGDVNGDGFLDLVAAGTMEPSIGPGAVRLWRGLGTGFFND